ncbi:IpaD/SipD/SspD family type III secretion system needle tip protein [Proteus cibi]|uniref:IpaD/SipD/SspD family type III secretion system needle tip protein n=1 Tax=Proteus cibi TaxID=2050966 RepID=UPI0032DA9109
MVSQAIGNINSFENNKNTLIENHFSENSHYIDEGDSLKVTQEDFNQERDKVKEKLQNKINDFIPMRADDLVSHYSLKEEEMINKNKYRRNSNKASVLAQGIANIQHADAKVNGRSSSNTDSLHDFFKEVRDSIITGKNDYLDLLKDIFSKYMDFSNELREILSELTELTKPGIKENTVYVFFRKFADKLGELRNKYSDFLGAGSFFFKSDVSFTQDEDGRYFRLVNGEKIYYKDQNQVYDAIEAIKALLTGIKGMYLDVQDKSNPPDIHVEFTLFIDSSDLDKIVQNAYEKAKKDDDILQSEFDLFKNSLDALEKKINTNLDELSKKYSAANSNYDNFVKIVSSTMNTLLEMAKGFLRF